MQNHSGLHFLMFEQKNRLTKMKTFLPSVLSFCHSFLAPLHILISCKNAHNFSLKSLPISRVKFTLVNGNLKLSFH